MDIAQEMLTTFNDAPDLLNKVITGDELWVYGYDIETKVQSSIPKRAFQNCFGNWKKRWRMPYIIGHCNPSVKIIELVSRTTYVVCVNFIHKSSPNDRFLRNFS